MQNFNTSNVSNQQGFEDPININRLNGKLIIDAEKGINKLGNIEFVSLPYIDNFLELNLTGSGNFKCFVEFEGRILCQFMDQTMKHLIVFIFSKIQK